MVNQEIETSSKTSKNSKLVPTLNPRRLDNSSLQFNVEKFNENECREWTQSIRRIVNEQGKMRHKIGEMRKPDSTKAKALQRWSSENMMVAIWLINTMLPKIGKAYLFLLTARAVWEPVHKTYSDGKNVSKNFELKT